MFQNPLNTKNLSVIVPVSEEVFNQQGTSPKYSKRCKNMFKKVFRDILWMIKMLIGISMMFMIGQVMLVMIRKRNKNRLMERIKFWKLVSVSVLITVIFWFMVVYIIFLD
jgi:hypothetical protein